MPRGPRRRQGKANKTLRPASLKQKYRAARLVWKARLEFAQRSCSCHWAPPRARRMWPAVRLLYIIWGSLGQRDKPQSHHLPHFKFILYSSPLNVNRPKKVHYHHRNLAKLKSITWINWAIRSRIQKTHEVCPSGARPFRFLYMSRPARDVRRFCRDASPPLPPIQ